MPAIDLRSCQLEGQNINIWSFRLVNDVCVKLWCYIILGRKLKKKYLKIFITVVIASASYSSAFWIKNDAVIFINIKNWGGS